MRNLLEEHRQTAFNGKVLTTIVRDVPVEFDFDDARFWNYDRDEVVEALLELEFRTITRNVPDPNTPTSQNENAQLGFGDAFAETEQTASAQEAAADADYRTVTTPEQLQEMVAELSTPAGFAFDTETTGTDPDEKRTRRAVFLEPNWQGVVRAGRPQRG